jgi:glutamyl-tRNA reductase
MENLNLSKYKTFYSIGLSYEKADANVRGKFSLDATAKTSALLQAKVDGLESLIRTSFPVDQIDLRKQQGHC